MKFACTGWMAHIGSILVVDDETNARTALGELLKDEGYNVATAADAFKGLAKFHEQAPDVVITDLKMPGMNGLELLDKIMTSEHRCEVVVMTAYGAVESAVKAMRQGAYDYLTKPLNFDELSIVVERAVSKKRLSAEVQHMRERLGTRANIKNIIGSSAPIIHVFDIVNQVGPSKASVLITGESGTGKELIAEALHSLSPRSNGPFIKLHCASLAESLLESELFGHEKGSFTGAGTRREGRFHAAHGGTLFLDEIGEISPSIQVKLLRFLQEKEFERVGGNETIKVDVRVVAATNRNLKKEVEEGRFREDLYYRLNVVGIEMPPLCDRGVDIVQLAEHFLQRYAIENEKVIEGFSRDAERALLSYGWPGNVRELENVVERAVVMSRSECIGLAELPSNLGDGLRKDGAPVIPGATLDDIERYAILKTMEAEGGSTSRVSKILGISVRKIQYKLHEYSKALPEDTDAVQTPAPLIKSIEA